MSTRLGYSRFPSVAMALFVLWLPASGVLVTPAHGALFNYGAAYPVASGSFAQAMCDLDHDGNQDWVLSDRDGSQVHVRLGAGDGSSTLRGSTPTAGQPSSLTILDANQDGHPDVAVCMDQPAGAIQVLLGDGAGGLAPQSPVASLCLPKSVEAGDFDGDGDTDLVTAELDISTNIAYCVFYENTGTGFTRRSSYPVGDRTQNHNLVVNDFDHDGDLDVAMALTDGRAVRVIFNDLGWIFHVGPAILPPSLIALNGIEGADLNSDGNLDLVAVNNNSHGYAIYLGHGDGTFTVTDAIMAEWQAPWIAAVADFDRDCHLDIAVGDYGTNKVYIMHGFGDGTFTLLPVSYDIPGAAVPQVGDFNNDGFFDLSIVCGGGYLRTLLGDSVTFFVEGVTNTVSVNGIAPVVGLINGDSYLDYVVSDGLAGKLQVWLGNGDGSFSLASVISVSGAPGSAALFHADSDGIMDLAICLSYPTNKIQILLGDGLGNFCPLGPFDIYSGPASVSAADLDGDGDEDLAVACSGPGVGHAHCLLYENVGGGAFNLRWDELIGDRTGGRSLVTNDFDQDGDLDVAMALTNGRSVRLVFNDGNWTFHVGPPIVVPTLEALNGIEGADFNGDGLLDLIAANNNSHGYAVFLGKGDGTFTVRDWIVPGWDRSAWTAVGDFDWDCDLDVVVADDGTNTLHILDGMGDGTFHALSTDYEIPGPGLPCSGDYNEDGLTDILVASHDGTSGAMRMLLGNSAAWPVTVAVGEPDPSAPRMTLSDLKVVPNPGNAQRRLYYSLDRDETVQMRVVDVSGRTVAVVADGRQAAGSHQVTWDGRDRDGRSVASGMYFVEMQTTHGQKRQSFTMIR